MIKYAIQDEANGNYVGYLGQNVRWFQTSWDAEKWHTFHDAVIAFAAFKDSLGEFCRIVEVV